jgi:hypothetical protein
MRSVLLFASSLFLSLSVFALPKTVRLNGTLLSRSSDSVDVEVVLTLKKETATKAKYVGQVNFNNLLQTPNDRIELNMNLAKGKSNGVIDLMEGYIAFDSKASYAMTVGQQLQLQYGEYHSMPEPPCNPLQDNFCHPGQQMPQLTDTGVLNLTVIQAQ